MAEKNIEVFEQNKGETTKGGAPIFPPNLSIYACPQCGYEFRTKQELDDHVNGYDCDI